MNPHLRVGSHLRCESAEKARVLAVDEDIYVAAQFSLVVEHTIAEARMVPRNRFDHRCGRHPLVIPKRYLDHVAASGPFA
jgi:hypothetical protein